MRFEAITEKFGQKGVFRPVRKPIHQKRQRFWCGKLRRKRNRRLVKFSVRCDRGCNSFQRKAFPFILKWIDIKPVIPRPDGNGKIPTPKQLSYLITRSIVDKGTQGTHDLKKVEDGIIPFYKDKISAALGHDMEHYIRKLVAEK